MKRIKYVLFAIVILLSVNVNASKNCDKTELARIRELSKKVEFDYDYKLENEKAVFTITAINLHEDLKVVIMENYYNQVYKEFKNDGTNKGSLKNFKEGEKVTVTIYAFVPNWCSGEKITTKTIKLPYYNHYYSEEKCKGYEGYKYCKQLIDSDISEETFEKGLNAYKMNRDKPKEEVKVEEDNTMKYIIIGVVSLIVGIGAVVLIVRNVSRIKKKNSL